MRSGEERNGSARTQGEDLNRMGALAMRPPAHGGNPRVKQFRRGPDGLNRAPFQ
jgi:hypothetical protein